MKISLEKIGKRYTTEWVFLILSTEFVSGNIYGLIGHNGSGKSTLLQIISGFVTPNEGKLEYNDGALELEHVHKHLSMAAPYLELLEELTVLETIQYQAKFKSYQEDITADWILKEMDLEQHSGKTLDQLSSGMKQRLKLGVALFSETDLLLLDEPCSNLDKKWISWYDSTMKKLSKNRLVIIASNSDSAELGHCTQPLIDVTNYRETP